MFIGAHFLYFSVAIDIHFTRLYAFRKHDAMPFTHVEENVVYIL